MIRLEDWTKPNVDQQCNSENPTAAGIFCDTIRMKIKSGFYDSPEIESELARKLVRDWRKIE